MKFFCENRLDGGGWALVRRVRQGSSWHPATDDLAGTHPSYGNYGGPTFNETFGRPYNSWITPATEFLFSTGRLINDVKSRCDQLERTLCLLVRR